MSVHFRPLSPENFRPCIELKLAEGQEYFVASNLMSIAQSKVYPQWLPTCIYNDETLIGFVQYGRSLKDGRYWILRLMIDKDFQYQGFGKKALLLLLELLRQEGLSKEVRLSFMPNNTIAAQLYENLGFRRTGEVDEDGEIIMELFL